MASYGALLIKATTSLTVGIGSIECPAASMRRISIFAVTFGSDSAPANNALRYEMNRSTTAATGTALTPAPFDPADPACVTVAKQNNTIQGANTAGVIPYGVPLNQQATFRWAALGDRKAILVPATANNGISFNTPVAQATPEGVVSVEFEEL